MTAIMSDKTMHHYVELDTIAESQVKPAHWLVRFSTMEALAYGETENDTAVVCLDPQSIVDAVFARTGDLGLAQSVAAKATTPAPADI